MRQSGLLEQSSLLEQSGLWRTASGSQEIPSSTIRTDHPSEESRAGKGNHSRDPVDTNEPTHGAGTSIATGFPDLDKLLAGHGWPGNGLTEVIQDSWGTGELSLLIPALSRLSQSRNQWLVLIAPPYIPYAPALESMGVNLARILVVNPSEIHHMLWAMETTLASGCCSAVLAWPEYNQSQYSRLGYMTNPSARNRLLKDKDLRRLQLACKNGPAWGVIFRPAIAGRQFSPAELRLHLTPESRSKYTRLQILKRRGGWPTTLRLDITRYAMASSLPLLLHPLRQIALKGKSKGKKNAQNSPIKSFPAENEPISRQNTGPLSHTGPFQ